MWKERHTEKHMVPFNVAERMDFSTGIWPLMLLQHIAKEKLHLGVLGHVYSYK